MPRRSVDCVDLTLENLHDLPGPCRGCVFWELDPATAEQARNGVDPEMEKEVWVSDTLLEWGRCGHLAYVNGAAAGHVLYAPAAYVPRSAAFPTAPVSPDAVLLMSGRVLPEFAGRGLGRLLVQAAARDAAQRGIKAIEAFGFTGAAPRAECLLPADYLQAVGFKIVRPHHVTPRLRLDVKVPGTWKADIEQAVDRLLGVVPAIV